MTARQNLEKLGLARRPLALKHSGGSEKYIAEADRTQLHDDNDSEDEDNNDDDEYASEGEQDMQADHLLDSSEGEDDEDEDNDTPRAGPSKEPNMSKKSKSIPKGYARIIRDEKGNAIDVIMSAYDEPDQNGSDNDDDGSNAEEDNFNGETEDNEELDTPWGRPFATKEEEKKLRKAAEPVPAKTAALRGMSRGPIFFVSFALRHTRITPLMRNIPLTYHVAFNLLSLYTSEHPPIQNWNFGVKKNVKQLQNHNVSLHLQNNNILCV